MDASLDSLNHAKTALYPPSLPWMLNLSSFLFLEDLGEEAGKLLSVQKSRDSGIPWIRGCLHSLDIPGQSSSVLPRDAMLLGASFLLAKTSYPFSVLLATSMLHPSSLKECGNLSKVLLATCLLSSCLNATCEYLSDVLGLEFLTSASTELFLSSP